ncbi:MAG: hypothetical protein ACYC5Q_14945 [Thermoleophilia bacterium]
MELTPRMKSWVTHLGVHAALASADALPKIIVVDSCTVSGDTITLPVSAKQRALVEPLLAANTWVALAPGQLGAVRAPYQFKGKGKLTEEGLQVALELVYCTKPGAEAGLRLDTLGDDAMKDFDESRWKDIDPPGVLVATEAD